MWLMVWAMACSSGPTVVQYEVARGDTLFVIAKAHGVTVDDLRRWNGIEGDRIEVGQVLRIEVEDPPAAVAARPAPTKGSGRVSAPAGGRALPPEQACLAPPGAADGDASMVASEGLSRTQVRTALDAFVPELIPCVEGEAPAGTLLLDLTIACTGRVAAVAVAKDPGWPAGVVACVSDTLRYAPFPAHDLPDGEQITWPLSFSGS
jgi:LysM repeat protein